MLRVSNTSRLGDDILTKYDRSKNGEKKIEKKKTRPEDETDGWTKRPMERRAIRTWADGQSDISVMPFAIHNL